ncbi:hypothetical protein CABS01_05916 [Colletotrichum abscissum]|uniref:uncharacterized protein n=1 Tax=Colletotrichum abscissum TaxID=1671311 RepID=UPI0027D74D02|nr:uncharacterized protein CABS01_05916 [Colletotrichum abscissum]KAK1518382.1 hypothetical protein CABS01_05916 [Colletotrichum abscissum]
MDAPLLQNVVLKFLNELKRVVGESTEVIEGKRQPKENILNVTPNHPEIHEDDSSDSSSFSEGLETTAEDVSQTELGQNSDEIDDIISSLVKISFRIRGISSRDSQAAHKATMHKEFIQDEELNTVDVFSVYSVFDRRHVEEWILQLRKSPESAVSQPQTPPRITSDEVHHEENKSHIKPATFKGSDIRLIERWSKATTVRRRVLAYWRRHARKLAKRDHEPTPQRDQNSSSLTPDTIDSNQTPMLPPIVLGTTHPESLPALSSKGGTLLSGTEATRLPMQMDMTDASSIVSYSTYFSEEGKSTDLPKPPKLKNRESEFTCPYCHVLCPKQDTKGRHWRDHIMQDLQPYQCTYPDCRSADVLFTSKDSWIDHESQDHRRVWRCSEHPDLFKSMEEITHHFELSHTTLGTAQVQEISKHAHSITQDLRTECPFCQSSGPFEEDLTSHMASHMERLALFSIPRSAINDDDDDMSITGGSGVAQGGGSAASLKSVNLTFSDAGSLASSGSDPEITGPQATESSDGKLKLDDALEKDAYSEIWDWLASEDHTLDFDSYIGRRHPGTLRWFFESQIYQSSFSSEGKVLYLRGLPGVGKSVLAAAIINDLRRRFESSGSRIAYYFCSSQRHNRATEALLRSLIRQILEGVSETPKLLQTIHQSYLKDGQLPSLLALLDAFVEATDHVSSLFIIIDGFDVLRGDQDRELSKVLNSLSAKPDKKVIVTSRCINYVDRQFRNWPVMNVKAVEEDLRSYARAATLRNEPQGFLEAVNLEEAETQVVQFSKNIFAFATIYLEFTPTEWMTSAVTGGEPQKMIDSFYIAEMKRNQNSSGFTAALELLAWVVRSPTLLKVAEVKEILHLQARAVQYSTSSERKVDPGQLYDLERLLFWCSGLVVLARGDVLRLFHPTANDYFTRNQKEWFPKAAENQAYLCCEYLTNATDRDESANCDLKYFETKFRFFTHAAIAWGRHAFQAFEQEGGLKKGRLYRVVRNFLSRGWRVQHVAEALRKNIKLIWNGSIPKSFSLHWTRLQLAIYFGLTDIVTDLLHEHKLGAKDLIGEGDNSLVALAAECGHMSISTLLWTRLNWEPCALDDGLLGAARGGFKNIAVMAMDHGADPRKPAPLCAASQCGHEDIVRQLLDTAPDLVKLTQEEPLRLAIKNGHSSVVRLLFERGTSMPADARKLLLDSIQRKDMNMVQILLEKEPRLANGDSEGGTTPLFLAIDQDDVAMVKVLLKCGASVLEEDEAGKTPAYVARVNGQKEIQDVIEIWERRRENR